MSGIRIACIRSAILQIPRQSNRILPNIKYVRNFTSKSDAKTSSTTSLLLKSSAVGAVCGTIYAGYNFYNETRTSDHKVNEKGGPLVIKEAPNVKIMRKIVNANDNNSGLEITLFQFQTCPFCCKVRAFLDYAGLSYNVVEVDAVLRQSIKWSPSKKVPIVLIKTPDGKYVQLNDSSTIISTLASYFLDKSQDFLELASFYPAHSYIDDYGYKKEDIMNKYFLMYQKKSNVSKEVVDEERKWRSWADGHLVHLISPNVYRNKDEALETFKWFSDIGEWNVYFPAWERNMMVYVGAVAMWAIAKRLKKRHNLSDDVRSHLYEACNKWTTELEAKNTKFMGGNKNPNLADLAIFGILSSMEGCSAFKDCLENTKIGSWFYLTKMHVTQNRGETITM